MLTKLGTELTKEEYVTKYMRNFEKLLLLGDRPKELTSREEQFLQYEKELCVLFYDQFIKKHHRAPDEATLDDQVKANFIERSKIFARSPLVTDEANFVQAHIDQI
ncbi:hypothetical protein ACFJYO_14240, partial [Enterococcus faecalis]